MDALVASKIGRENTRNLGTAFREAGCPLPLRSAQANFLEPQMSKRKMATKRAPSKPKPATSPKHTQRPKVAARAQRKKQALIRSPKDTPLRPVAAEATESPVERGEAVKPEAPDHRAQAAILEAILQSSLQNDAGWKVSDSKPAKGFEFSLPLANVQAYQAKLLEVIQANMQFGFEFIQRLSAIRSPFEIWAILAEFAGRRIAMIAKHSEELSAFWRSEAIRGRTALPGR